MLSIFLNFIYKAWAVIALLLESVQPHSLIVAKLEDPGSVYRYEECVQLFVC